MALQINLPPELEQHYRNEAAKRGLKVEDLLIQVIQEELAKSDSRQTMTEQPPSKEHGDS